jgi:hypothetical protein
MLTQKKTYATFTTTRASTNAARVHIKTYEHITVYKVYFKFSSVKFLLRQYKWTSVSLNRVSFFCEI